MSDYSAVIASSQLFRDIPADQLPAILQCLQASQRSFTKNQVIFWAGQTVTQVALVLEGEVQLWQEDILGNRSIHNRFLPGEIFGEVYACNDQSLIPVSAVAVRPAEALFIDQQRLLGKGGCAGPYHRQLLENLLFITSQRALELSRKMSFLSRRTLREKLLGYLTTQARLAENCRFTIPFSRQELADYLSVDRSALSKELSRMKEEGLLDYHRSDFHLFPDTCGCCKK